MAWPVTFNGRTYTANDFIGTAYVSGIPDLMQDAATHFANGYVGASTSSVTIGTGTKTLTVEPNKLFAPGQPVVIASVANPTTVYMDGRVTSYNPSTGVLVVNVAVVLGSGTLASWSVTIGGARVSTTLPVAISEGGHGATTAAQGLTNLGITAVAQTFLGQATQTLLRTAGLGFSAFGESLAVAANQGAAQTLLGISGVGATLINQATQALMRTTGLGLTAFGDSLAVAANALAGRTALGVGESHGAGTTSNPSMSFAGDQNTGFYNSNGDEVGVSAGGVNSLRFASTGLRFISGSAANPSVAGLTEVTTGLFIATANTLGISCGGNQKVEVSPSSFKVFEAEAQVAIPGYITGMGLVQNTLDTANDVDITAGACTSSNNLSLIRTTTTLTKRLDATWTAGNNGGLLDTGTRASNTWYHIYAIYNPTTKASDFVATATLGSPTLPSGYTRSRRIGSIYSNSSNQNKDWRQFGRTMLWTTPSLDVSTNTLSTAANFSVTVPSGIDVIVIGNATMSNTNNSAGYVRSSTHSDSSPDPDTGTALANMYHNGGSLWSAAMMRIEASLGQIRASASLSSTKFRFSTLGYEDLLSLNGVAI